MRSFYPVRRKTEKTRRVFCNVRAYVSCRGYAGILLRAQSVMGLRIKVASRISG